MVGEFPELQGVMGGYYARAQGEPEPVTAAIRDHYAPKGPDDSCPTAPESVVLALADKLDALAGFFSAGIKPTGSKDPFALRRAALGVIRIVVENQLRFNLRQRFLDALYGYGGRRGWPMEGNTADELMDFIADRLVAHLRERNARHDLVAAVLGKKAAYYRDNDLMRILIRIESMKTFLDSEDGGNLLFLYHRAGNIVEIEEKKDGFRYNQQPSLGLLQRPEEKALFDKLKIAQKEIDRAIGADNFQQAMAELIQLRQPVDDFLNTVMVNVPEPALRENRLLLLNQVRSAFERVADFSLVKDAGPASV
jgi:glycyl-tRNA synthetase beta chain